MGQTIRLREEQLNLDRIIEKIESKANLGLENTGRITNCLTKIPQDINLTLENGELKLTNSYIYIPNGPDVFEKVNVTTSRNWTVEANKTFLLFLNTKSVLTVNPVEKAFSGDTAPEGAKYSFWYDTANNKIKYVANDGVWQEFQTCFPIAIISSDGTGKIARIDQVFNGFGFIGNTIFILPGVEGLIPNGRNADGSLKNILWINTILRTRTFTSQTAAIYIRNDGWFGDITSVYNEIDNILSIEGTDRWMNAGIVSSDSSGRINSILPKTAFHAVDYSDTSWAASQGKPSDKYINLTLGASGSTYTAPANGWLYMQGQTAASADGANYIECEVRKDENSSYLYREGRYSPTNYLLRLTIPVLKGRVCVVTYSSNISLNKALRFICDEGEN